MRYTWLDEYLMSKPGTTKNTENWNWIRYMIGGKMYAAICCDEAWTPYYITLKLDPAEGESLRRQHPDLLPGHYMNKLHWNSVRPDGDVPDELLREMADKSYGLIFNSLTKKLQREILGESL